MVGHTLGAQASTGCGNTPKLITAGAATTPLTLAVNQYYVKMPQSFDKDYPCRIILSLHALGGNAQQVADGSGGYLPRYGLPALITDTVNAVYVAPNGLNNGWGN